MIFSSSATTVSNCLRDSCFNDSEYDGDSVSSNSASTRSLVSAPLARRDTSASIFLVAANPETSNSSCLISSFLSRIYLSIGMYTLFGSSGFAAHGRRMPLPL
ncbi:hypothetical protein ATCV1_z055R [Acanthocystis turfacea chlorella virus 1]|uniref:Uncharacterized protein z055R n=1 Tax=Chlorovirus heliozoae TaxID=322019 RepID=A7K815_9PHYC|nr:hypothetical protein ATCV1_z055R [Acanthocystis turfacea chlorella virus 1]ABT16189.1 hypothetical protein ATCV1_z055R [Acanthocystis turfacea chlorella virus 1]